MQMPDDDQSRYDTFKWRSLAAIAKHRAGMRCQRCGSDGPLDAHHIQPVGEGGRFWDLANLRALCRSCHQAQHPGWPDDDEVDAALREWMDEGERLADIRLAIQKARRNLREAQPKRPDPPESAGGDSCADAMLAASQALGGLAFDAAKWVQHDRMEIHAPIPDLMMGHFLDQDLDESTKEVAHTLRLLALDSAQHSLPAESLDSLRDLPLLSDTMLAVLTAIAATAQMAIQGELLADNAPNSDEHKQ